MDVFRRAWILYAALAVALPPAYGQQTVKVIGNFLAKSYGQNGTAMPSGSTTNSFTAYVSTDGRYSMRLSWRGTVASQMAFDGNDTFDVRGLATVDEAIEPLATNAVPAYVSAGSFPYTQFYGDDGRGLLWLGLCSSSFFRTNQSSTMPLPWSFPRTSLMAYGYRYSCVLATGSFSLPLSMEFFRDSSLDLATEDELNRITLNVVKTARYRDELLEQLERRKTEWKDGYRTATYEAEGFHDTRRFGIPTRFVCRIFHPLWLRSPRLEYEAQVDSIAEVTKPVSFRPMIKGESLLVLDSRFRKRDAAHALDELIYRRKVGEDWKAPDDPGLIQLANQAFNHSPRKSFSAVFDRRRLVRLVFLAAVIALPAAGFLIWYVRRAGRFK